MPMLGQEEVGNGVEWLFPCSAASAAILLPSWRLLASLSTQMIRMLSQLVASTRLCGQPPGVQHGQPGTSSSMDR
jgi:hypothetical protein